jgi:hypothetical protein
LRTRTDARMIEALARFHDRGLEPDQPTEHQLKIGDVTFYPRKDTVFVHGKICRRDENWPRGTGRGAAGAGLPPMTFPTNSSPTRKLSWRCTGKTLSLPPLAGCIGSARCSRDGRVRASDASNPIYRAISHGPAHGLVRQYVPTP